MASGGRGVPQAGRAEIAAAGEYGPATSQRAPPPPLLPLLPPQPGATSVAFAAQQSGYCTALCNVCMLRAEILMRRHAEALLAGCAASGHDGAPLLPAHHQSRLLPAVRVSAGQQAAGNATEAGVGAAAAAVAAASAIPAAGRNLGVTVIASDLPSIAYQLFLHNSSRIGSQLLTPASTIIRVLSHYHQI